MKTHLQTLVLLLCGYLVTAQQSEMREIDDFEDLRVSGAIDLHLVKGSRPMVKVVTEGFSPRKIMTEVSGRTLRIARSGNQFGRDMDVDVYVTYSELTRIDCHGASNVSSKDVVRADEVEINVSTAGYVEIPVRADRVFVQVKTAGQVILSGDTGSLDFFADTSGTLDAYQLSADVVKATVQTAASARVSVRDEIKANVSTAGSLRYRGNPRRSNTNATTGGSVKQMN
ncbi:MAG: DUF2807 domain-containing protein [Bacteroidetes bacterium]|nr:DUF2807 domain-containing protein [Bacteroidota bacterium]